MDVSIAELLEPVAARPRAQHRHRNNPADRAEDGCESARQAPAHPTLPQTRRYAIVSRTTNTPARPTLSAKTCPPPVQICRRQCRGIRASEKVEGRIHARQLAQRGSALQLDMARHPRWSSRAAVTQPLVVCDQSDVSNPAYDTPSASISCSRH
ncbi:hypothetical protein FA95DRAFT_990388 [Auriscalpium vulgare]|uniref:Uncharacterized protein n=1 Tax=Auriscalpium vulgare TaxID=40419 RepID=A0ACB8R6K8_9AGAM|nr:hypothetical protein FA95DRAFT_990388 [Auriscalpium vulgare]